MEVVPQGPSRPRLMRSTCRSWLSLAKGLCPHLATKTTLEMTGQLGSNTQELGQECLAEEEVAAVVVVVVVPQGL